MQRALRKKSTWRKSINRRIPSFIWMTAFFAILTTGIIAPIATEEAIPNLADYFIHLSAIIQAKLALLEGQFPLRVMPLEMDGLRYPFYQFSSPTTYTFAALIYQWITPDNPLIAMKFTIWCGLLLGAIYMRQLAYWFIQSQPAAVLASIVYLYAPYCIIIVNHLASLNEIVALGFLPAVVYYSLQRYYFPDNYSFLLKCSLTWFLMITIHIVTFAYISFFIGLLLLLITMNHPRRLKNLLKVGIAYGLGCLLAMWYLAPVAVMGKYFILSSTYSDSNYVRLFHPLLSQLVSPVAGLMANQYGSALLKIHPSVGWPILFAAAICGYAFLQNASSGHKRGDFWLPYLLIIFSIAFFLVWSPVDLWKYFPQPLLIAQHCWRLLSQVIWIGALLFAWAICWLFNNRLDSRHLIIGTILVVMSAAVWFPTSENSTQKLADFIQEPYLIYNEDAYLLNFNKYVNFVDQIDSIKLNDDTKLKIASPYFIPPSLIKIAYQPTIQIDGDIPKEKNSIQLVAKINNQVVAFQQFESGPFTWKIPLSSMLNASNSDLLIHEYNDINSKPANISIQKMLLTGFLPKGSVMEVNETRSHCKQKKTTLFCRVKVAREIELLELPIFYYPGLLNITLNKQPVQYHSILRQGQLLTTIKPSPGWNDITVQFSGLNWANQMSIGAWSLWFITLIGLIIKKRMVYPKLK